MGAGNPLIKSFDPERYEAKTYFIDFVESYRNNEEWLKEELESRGNEETIEELDDEKKYEIINNQAEFDIEDFQNNYFFENENFGNTYYSVEPKDNYIEALSARFLGGATALAQSDDAYIVTCGEDAYHYSIGIVPKFTYDEICEEVDYEQQHKYDWYVSRGKDYDAMCQRLADKLYEKKIKLFKKNHEPTMRILHSHYKEHLSSRNGAWCSAPLKLIGKDFKFL